MDMTLQSDIQIKLNKKKHTLLEKVTWSKLVFWDCLHIRF